jgi:hypothetical protein
MVAREGGLFVCGIGKPERSAFESVSYAVWSPIRPSATIS